MPSIVDSLGRPFSPNKPSDLLNSAALKLDVAFLNKRDMPNNSINELRKSCGADPSSMQVRRYNVATVDQT